MEIQISNLKVKFASPAGEVEAVKGVSFRLGQEKLGIVGESGSGKSLTARSILKLLPSQARMFADELTFDGIDIQQADETQMRQIRGKRAGLIMQDPKYSLNPVMSVGRSEEHTSELQSP